ncbi:hypothetical protein EVJ58_g1288 [Rhodofomes roseus]|uniref:Uncharacterized protein n=1 Tax=Rhodofomes roseus TaxID=34475 RepID=A0A4Y9Z043_9APHY|nr:hypothetical protein EVJ58_g1288 [Rhodofomes roseus]
MWSHFRPLQYAKERQAGVDEVLFKGQVDDGKLHFSGAFMQHDDFEYWRPGELTIARLTAGPYAVFLRPAAGYQGLVLPSRLVPQDMTIKVDEGALTILGEVEGKDDEFLWIKAQNRETLWQVANCFARKAIKAEKQNQAVHAQLRSCAAFLRNETECQSAMRTLESSYGWEVKHRIRLAFVGGVVGGVIIGMTVLGGLKFSRNVSF